MKIYEYGFGFLQKNDLISFWRYGSLLFLIVLMTGFLCGCSNNNNQPQTSINPSALETANTPATDDAATNILDDSNYVYALIKETAYSDGEKTYVMKYSYDDQGRLIQIERDSDSEEVWDEELGVYWYSMTADGIFNYSTLFEYDDNNNVVKKWNEYIQNDHSPNNFYEYKYEFDEVGNIARCTEYYEGEPSYTGYICDFLWQDGFLISEELTCAEDSTWKVNEGLYSYTYDTKGRVATYTTQEDGETIVVTLTYGETGKVEQINAKAVGYAQEIILRYNYDTEGNLIPVEGSGVEFEFDDYGNILSIQEEDGDRYEYQYQKIECSSDCILTGNDIAIIRQQVYTEYYALFVPGWNHAVYIFNLD